MVTRPPPVSATVLMLPAGSGTRHQLQYHQHRHHGQLPQPGDETTAVDESSSLASTRTSGPVQRLSPFHQQGAVAAAPSVVEGTTGPGSARRCVGCRHPICDQYMLHVDPNLNWHAECLRCTECLRSLDETCTCFVRDGFPYCKSDYSRLFGVKCSRCGLDFDRNQLVMRARDRVYHVECFRCVVCRLKLLPGSEFALRPTDSGLVCRTDYDFIGSSPSLNMAAASVDSCATPSHEIENSSSPDAVNMPRFATATSGSTLYGSNNNIENEIESKTRTGCSDSSASSVSSKKHLSSTTTGSRQPGASRGSGRASHHPHDGQGHHSTTKTTRIRTVLNEKQLHTLRTCYAANPRPDALMKDQLVEMTGLSSRVIRVWFQNKRCKDKKRTILIKQLQQQHQDKVHGIPMIATSPIRMQDHQAAGTGMLQASAVQIHHQYVIHQPSTPSQQSLGDAHQTWPPPGCSSLAEYAMSRPGSTPASIPAVACSSTSPPSSSSISPTSLPPVADIDSESAGFRHLLDAYGGRRRQQFTSAAALNHLDDVDDDLDDAAADDEDDIGSAAAAALSLFPEDDDTVVSLDEPCVSHRYGAGHQRHRRNAAHGQLEARALLVATRMQNHYMTMGQSRSNHQQHHHQVLRCPSSGTRVEGGGMVPTGGHLVCTDTRC